MTRVVIRGIGAVSPAGWGATALLDALRSDARCLEGQLSWPGRSRPLRCYSVPKPAARPSFVTHARLRRTSPIAQYAVAAALEALGDQAAGGGDTTRRLGIVYCAMSGCVNFSRRFYDETLKDPATASPLVFPETVFNAPASHLAALLKTTATNYTLIGDPGTFLQGLGVAADWLLSDRVDGCLVIGAEELDWLVAGAFGLFDADGIVSEGAGALYLARGGESSEFASLEAVTQPYLFFEKGQRAQAASRARAELGTPSAGALLCDGVQGVPRLDRDEWQAWQDWNGPRCSPKRLCGEAFVAAAAWQCVAAVGALQRGQCSSAEVSVVGCNQQAIAARFGRS